MYLHVTISATSNQLLLKNLVVFASGSGSNFQSLIDAVSEGKLEANIVGLISNNESAYAIERADINGIQTLIISPNDFDSETDYSIELLKTLKDWETDLIVLAGYLRKIPTEIIEVYRNRILNIHPSLLPKYGGKGFYGSKVHEAVIKNKEIESGCTVHLVTEEYDKGPILGQAKVQITETDSPADLAKKVLEKEHQLLSEVIQEYLKTFKN